jgi:hypothetical protein
MAALLMPCFYLFNSLGRQHHENDAFIAAIALTLSFHQASFFEAFAGGGD